LPYRYNNIICMAKSTLKSKWSFKKQVLTLYYALKDERTPWYAKVTAFSSLIYLFSPADFLPDVIPLAGYIDDLFVVPFLIDISTKLLPYDVKRIAEEKARVRGKKILWILVIAVLAIAGIIAYFIYRK
jgi:uncharacterized membrane protein YkvA (DUF1232 family)